MNTARVLRADDENRARGPLPAILASLLEGRSCHLDRDRPSTIIPAGARVHSLDLPEGVLLNGAARDLVSHSGAVLVNRGGLITGKVKCRRLVIMGRVGAADAEDCVIECDLLSILSSARITRAELRYRKLECLADGALLDDAVLRKMGANT